MDYSLLSFTALCVVCIIYGVYFTDHTNNNKK